MTAVRDTVIVLNARFVPDGRRAPYLYGVVQHSLRAAEVLRAAGVNVGFVMYERCEDAIAPVVEERQVVGRFPGAILRFHFGMPRPALVAAFREAVDVASRVWPGFSPTGARPLLYLQTSVVLPFAPPELDVVVTHHSPFVDNVRRVLGPAGAQRAFDWDHPKSDHLARMQAEGLAVAAGSENVRCGEISRIQEAYLLERNVAPARVGRLPQPLDGACARVALPTPVRRAVAPRRPGRLVALTAVSRLDYFKNVELFVKGAVEGLRRRHLDKAIVIGGFPRDEERERLKTLVPRAHTRSILFAPRIARAALVGSLFPRLAPNGVFVCSSRFDLVPYTALEAARAGVCTVVPDSGTVGAAEYLPATCRFAPSPEGLGELFGRLAGDSGGRAAFGATSDAIRRRTSAAAFLGAFRELCASY